MSSSYPFRPHDIVDSKYRIEHVLGAGGMGVVYAASHVTLGAPVAIKALLPKFQRNAVIRERFVREARAAALLKSAHVTRILDIGTDAATQTPFIVMERLIGANLEHHIEQHGALEEKVAVDYVIQACVSLAEAHGRGIIHRDLKTENLFLTRSPGRDVVKVLDFGISKNAHDTKGLTATADVMGTPHFMSPEQIKSARDVSPATDIWALGAILYRLLTAALPFDGVSFPQLCARIMFEPHVPLERQRPGLSPEITAIVERCLAKDPKQRFANAAELGLALQRVPARVVVPHAKPVCAHAATQAVEAVVLPAKVPVVLPAPVPERPRKKSRRLSVLAFAVLALTCFAGWTQRSSAMPLRVQPEVTEITSPPLLAAPPSTEALSALNVRPATRAMPGPSKPRARGRK